MSYCRWGEDSDVYVIGEGDCLCCCACGIGISVRFKTRTQMIEHLEQHRKDGDKVPQYAIERLFDEIKTKGNEVK